MTINEAGLKICKEFESFRSAPYICPAGVPTIGYGTTRYPWGNLVSMRDKHISMKVAEGYLFHDMRQFERAVNDYCQPAEPLNENQFSALVDLVYNIGPTNFRKSTLLKKVNANPNDPSIRAEFMKWVWADASNDGIDNDGDGRIDEPGEKKQLPGLIRRRKAEADLYFTQP